MSGNTSRRYPPELRERAVRMVGEVRADHDSQWAPMTQIAKLLGIGTPETVRKWCRQDEVDAGRRPGVMSEESAERDLEGGLALLRGRARPATALIVAFIDQHVDERDGEGLRWGVADSRLRIRGTLRGRWI